MKFLISIIFMTLFFFPAYTEENNDQKPNSIFDGYKYNNNIGFAGGIVIGYGISYRKWFNKEKHAIQITGFPFYEENIYEKDENEYDQMDGYSRHGNISLGITFLNKLAKHKNLCMVNYAGTNIYYDFQKDNYSYFDSYENKETKINTINESMRITIGGGIGGEVQIWRFIFNLMVGANAYYDVYDKTKGLSPSIESGIFLNY